MRAKFLFIVGLACLFSEASTAHAKGHAKGAAPAESSSLYSIPLRTIEGKSATLADYKGKVLLVVNTASECGFTPQYQGLEELYQRYREKGLVVLGFPSNDFGGQEPGTEAEIKKFCQLRYKTTFPLFAKVNVAKNPHPLFARLQAEAGEKVAWNFGKFLVTREGRVERYFGSNVTPLSAPLTGAVEAALKGKEAP